MGHEELHTQCAIPPLKNQVAIQAGHRDSGCWAGRDKALSVLSWTSCLQASTDEKVRWT